MSRPAYDTLDNFLRDDAFRAWVTGKRPQDRFFWQEWLEQNPDKRELYEQAAALCVVLQGQSDPMSQAEIQAAADEIKQSFTNRKPFQRIERPERRLPNSIALRWLLATTGVAALLAIGFFLRESAITNPKQTAPVSVQEPIIEAKDTWQQIANTGKQAQLVLLPDGSSVLLSQGGQLRYDEKAAKREVYLQGEGFFEVVRDTKRPFWVYTSSLTTRVLGTSFQVQDSQTDQLAYVNVRTGKVTVHSTKDPTHSLILVVNEQAKLDTRTDKLTKQLIQPTGYAPTSVLTESLDFEFAPVVDVLDKLEQVYHTQIEFDRKTLQNCTFKGDLTGLPFAEKISLVCSAVEASYEQRDGHIIVKGNGCTL